MTQSPRTATAPPRAEDLYRDHQRSLAEQTDHLFACLMFVQWIAAIAAALWISPRAWSGTVSRTHLHVWLAVCLGGVISALPIVLAMARPGKASTRYVIATAQMLMSSLLIHLTGGRIETHFHVFGSLAFLAFYRDWRVLVPATIVVAVDHFVRGIYWPQSAFGVLAASHWRWLEHAGWVIFEDIFLIGSCIRSQREMRSIAERTAELHASQERYRAIVDRAEGIFLVDAATKNVLECNVALGNLLGYGVGDTALNSLYGFDSDTPDGIDAVIRDFLQQKSPIDLERQYKRRDGSLIDVTVNLSALAHESGDILCGAVRDISRQKEAHRHLVLARRKAEEASQAKSDFLSNVSHELRTPLTVIHSFTEILLDPQMSPSERERIEFVGIVANQAQRLNRLVSDVLDISRIEAGRFSCQLSSMQPKTMIASCIASLKKLAEEKGLAIVDDIGETCPNVTGDQDRLIQVLTNLVGNAIKFTPSGGTIHVRGCVSRGRRPRTSLRPGRETAVPHTACMESTTPESGEYFVLSVHDTGIGIDPTDHQRIFEKFGQVGNILTAKPPGTGLGLTISGEIVIQHGGALWVESARGEGAIFAFSIPVAKAVLLDKSAPAGVRRDAQGPRATAGSLVEVVKRNATGKRILVVDDEPAIVTAITAAFEPLGYTVLPCYSGSQAIAEARSLKPDAIILDIMMPEINGYDVLQLLKSDPATAAIPVIVLSVLDGRQRAFELGATEYVLKPFATADLVDNVRTHA